MTTKLLYDRSAQGIVTLTINFPERRNAYDQDVLDGIEHAPGAIAGLYRGENLGKRLIRLTT